MANIGARNGQWFVGLVVRGLLLAGLLTAPSGMSAATSPAAGPASGLTVERMPADSGPSAPTTCTPPSGLEGVDVSNFNAAINWTQVAQTKAFAYAKAGQGNTLLDPRFQTNYTGIKAAGMKAGAYFYFDAGGDPAVQATNLITQLQSVGFTAGDLIPMFVVDSTGGQSSQIIVSKLQTATAVVRSALLITPGIATSPSFWDGPVGGSTAFADYPLWDEHVTTACPVLPAAWNNWALWQYSFTGTVTGITGTVDLDLSNGAILPIFTGTQQLYLPLMLR